MKTIRNSAVCSIALAFLASALGFADSAQSARNQLTTGSQAKDFLKGTQIAQPLTFLLDPGYKFTNAYGLRWDAPRETAYPSTIVVDESGKITFVKISETHKGRATAEEILAAL